MVRRVGQDGSIALEAALIAPLLAVLVAGVLSVTTVAADQLGAERAARAAARSVAVTGVVGGAGATLPPGARVDVERVAGSVTVVVRVPGRVVGVGYEVRAVATAVLEPALP